MRLPVDSIVSAIDAVVAIGDTLDWEKLGYRGEREATSARLKDWLVKMSEEPADGDEWMNISPEEMESLLRQGAPPPISVQETSQATVKEDEPKDDMQAGAQKLQNIVEGVHTFLDGSGEALRGAELPMSHSADATTSPISFDIEKFMGLLSGVGDPSSGVDDNLFNDDDSVDDDSDAEGSDDNATNGTSRKRDSTEGEVNEENEGASEDEGQEFTGAYYSHMDNELDDSEILAKSFERQADFDGDPISSDPLSSSGSSQPIDSSDYVPSGEENGQVEHQVVDLDANLVKHLLESFASQEGLAGPASNLLQELGTFFPAQSPQESQLEAAPQHPPRAASEFSTREGSTVEFMYQLD